MTIINTSKNNCKNCYKCIRECPVKAIEFSNNQAQIIEEECVLCGICYNACPQEAKQLFSDLDFVKTWLLQGESVHVSIAPSFLSDFYKSDFNSIEKGLIELGFSGAQQTSVAATYVKKKYETHLKDTNKKVLISSCCPTINLLIQKHYPHLIPFLSTTPSPMVVHGTTIKQKETTDKVVFIGPCISKKQEQSMYPDSLDAVISFLELKTWFEEANITYTKTEDSMNLMGRTNQFPIAGGIIKSFTSFEQDRHYLAVDGIKACMEALDDISHGIIDQCFIEMSACRGSCVGGPLRNRKHNTPLKSLININRNVVDADFSFEENTFNTIEAVYDNLQVVHPQISEKALQKVLFNMGKDDTANHLNCGSCGYLTCRDKAIAVIQGKADLTMCLPYLKDRAESFSDHIIQSAPNGVIVLNEKLQIQVMNPAACEIFQLNNAKDSLTQHIAVLKDPTLYYDLIESKKRKKHKRYYLPDVERFIDETIVYDYDFKVFICVLRDITKEINMQKAKTATKNQALAITNEVIQKQMRAVHEIASLLGETTADTKVALSQLKDVLNDE